MKGRVRSPLPRHRRKYSPDNRRDQQYPPRHGHEYSSSYRQSPDNRRNPRHSPPHGFRDGQLRLDHGSSSRYSEMERSRQGASGSNGLRERRDYGRDLDGERDNRLVELTRYNEDLRRDDHLKRVNIDAKLDSEYPSGPMERRDYPRRLDEDRDGHLWKMSNPSEGLPERDSLYPMFQGKREGKTSNSSHSAKYFQEYGGNIGSITGNSKRNYQDDGFEGLGSSRTKLEKPAYPSKETTFLAYPSQSGSKRNYQDHGDGDSYSSFKKFSSGRHRDEESRLYGDLSREKLYRDRPQSYTREGEMPRFYSKDETTKLYTREEDNPRFYSRDEKPDSYSMEGKSQLYLREEKPYQSYRERESQYSLNDTLHREIPMTQYKASTTDPFANSVNDLRCSYKDNPVVGSEGYNRSSGYLTNPLPTEKSMPFMEEATNYRKDKLSNNLGTHMDIAFPQLGRSDYTEMVPLSDKSYGKMSIDKNDSRHIDSSGIRNMDPILAQTGFHRKHLTERLWDDRRSPLEHIVSSYLNVTKSSNGTGSNVEALSRGEVDLGYEREVYHSHENKSSKEDFGYGQDEGLQPHDERKSSYLREDFSYGRDAGHHDRKEYSYMPKDYNHDFGRANQVFDGDYGDPLEGVITEGVGKLTQSKDVSKRRRNIKERLCINRNIFKKAPDFRSNKSMLGGSRYRYPWVSNAVVQSRKFKALEPEGSSVGKARISNPGIRDIKKRLGPAQPVNSPVKKGKNWKVVRRNKEDDGNGSVHDEEGGPSEYGVVKAKSEPPEKSEEFKQLVRNAFFKFVKQLNENAVELKKFTEQGKAGTLKCWVCGSDSKEFPDTESLVKHACSATRVGFRTQHLGFHKALCALMGWKAVDMHNDEWVREVLSVAEIASLKKDLILWPPLVIVHNSSIEKSNPDGQMTVSLEDLETMIKDMGFGEKTKVCRGKPVNQSIMLVKFSATYSGFQEAERLHKFFAGNKHGRNEFLKIKSKGPINIDDTPKASANNMQDVLYGFMGTSRDLNKLDLETKKRCVVRSKKEIQDLGDAPLIAERE